MNGGLVLLVSAAIMAALGLFGYRSARRSVSKSRYAAMSLFGHGALMTSGILTVTLFLRIDSLWPFAAHFNTPSETLYEILNCDLEVSCVAATILALVAVVLGASLFVGQVSVRLLLRRCVAAEEPPASEALRRRAPVALNVRIMAVRDAHVDAFSFAVLRLGGPRLVHAEDVVVVTSGLRDILGSDEIEAVVAHEAAHIAARDNRYLPFFSILSKILFFDPVLRIFRSRVTRHHELAADRGSAAATGRPLSLARALLKVYMAGNEGARATGLLGRGSGPEILERIEALIALGSRAPSEPH